MARADRHPAQAAPTLRGMKRFNGVRTAAKGHNPVSQGWTALSICRFRVRRRTKAGRKSGAESCAGHRLCEKNPSR